MPSRSDWPRSFVPLAAAGLFVLVLLRPIHDVDLFWQLKLGELTIDQRAIPATEPFLAGRESEPLIPVYWLGQVLYSAASQIGGWRGLQVFDAVLWLGGFLIPALQFRSSRAIALSLILGFLAASPFQSLRPQSGAIFAFGCIVATVHRITWLRVLLALPVLVVWQNVHPSVIVAAGFLALATAGATITSIRQRQPKPWPLVILMLAAGLAIFATPAGSAILTLSRQNSDVTRWMRTGEWLPIWDEQNLPNAVGPLLVFAIVIVLVVCNWSRIRWQSLVPAVALLLISLFVFRFAAFAGVALITLIGSCLEPETAEVPPGHSRLAWIRALLPTVIASLLLPVRWAEYYPFAALDELKERHVKGTIYCHHTWGSLLPYFGHPDWHASHDGRHYMATRDEWQQYFQTAAGRVPVDEVKRRYRPAAFLLRPGTDAGLIELLTNRPDWVVAFSDRNAIVFLPAPGN